MLSGLFTRWIGKHYLGRLITCIPERSLTMNLMRSALIVLVITAGLVLFLQPALAEAVVKDVVIYETSFNQNPQWTTNSPRSYYWVPEKGVYHYTIEPSSGSYAYIPVTYDNGPFTLEYDLTPTSTQENSAFRIGLTTKEMIRTGSTVALTEFQNGKNGRLMVIHAVTPSNKLFEVTSYAFSYAEKSGGKTVNFVDNKTYHVSLQFDNERDILTMLVTNKATGGSVWSYFLATNEAMNNMDRIAMGALGDFSAQGPKAEGYIDNVRLTTIKTVEVTTAAPTTAATQTAATTKTAKPTTKATTMEEPAETQSPISPVTIIAAIGTIGAAAVYGRPARKR